MSYSRRSHVHIPTQWSIQWVRQAAGSYKHKHASDSEPWSQVWSDNDKHKKKTTKTKKKWARVVQSKSPSYCRLCCENRSKEKTSAKKKIGTGRRPCWSHIYKGRRRQKKGSKQINRIKTSFNRNHKSTVTGRWTHARVFAVVWGFLFFLIEVS